MFLIFLNFFPASSHSLNLNSSITSSSMYITYWTFLNDPVPSASIIVVPFSNTWNFELSHFIQEGNFLKHIENRN